MYQCRRWTGESKIDVKKLVRILLIWCRWMVIADLKQGGYSGVGTV